MIMRPSEMRRTNLQFVLAAALATIAILSGAAKAAEQAVKPINTIDSPGIAIKGFDPVAYFLDGGPRKGKKQFASDYMGAKWLFTSVEHKRLFDAEPTKYTPVYGGYCAYGTAQGRLVKIEGDAWTIRGGKLYLNYDKDVQKTWLQDPDGYIKEADSKWPDLITKK